MIKIKATFTGTDSHGYVNGKEYELEIKNSGSMSIQRTSGTGHTTYESLSAFLKNWDKITRLK